jgi:nucleoside-diphosphate-sugar epimerase
VSKILIVGCGYVGTQAGVALARAGHEVWGVRRNARFVPRPIKAVAADIADPGGLASLPDPVDAVVLAAGLQAEPDLSAYTRLFVEGYGGLVNALAARAAPPRRLLLVSTTSVFGEQHGAWVDEATPARAEDPQSLCYLEAERIVRSSPIESSVLRLGGIYGPGRIRLVKSVLEGKATVPSGPRQFTNHIHRDDAAGAIAHLLRLERVEPLYLGVDCEPATRLDILTWIARKLQATPPRVVSAPVGESRSSRGNKRCSNRLLVASGYRFTYPTYREGYEAVVGEMG